MFSHVGQLLDGHSEITKDSVRSQTQNWNLASHLLLVDIITLLYPQITGTTLTAVMYRNKEASSFQHNNRRLYTEWTMNCATSLTHVKDCHHPRLL